MRPSTRLSAQRPAVIATLLSGIAVISPASAATSLDNSQSHYIQGERGSKAYFQITIPAGATQLSASLRGGSGDADLYVQANRAPTMSNFLCRPYRWGNQETCKGSYLEKTTQFHLMVHGYQAYRDVALTVRYTAPDGTPQQQAFAPAPTPEPTPEPTPTPTPVATPTPAPAATAGCNVNAAQQALLDAHNEARSSGRYCGDNYYGAVAPVSWNCSLTEAAAGHNADMANAGFFSHTSSNGATLSDRALAAGYHYNYVGENIAAGYSSVASVMSGWLDSPGHCANIMSEHFTEMGAHRLNASGSDYGSYWTVDFGKPQ